MCHSTSKFLSFSHSHMVSPFWTKIHWSIFMQAHQEYLIYSNLVSTWNANDPCFDWKRPSFLEVWSLKIEDISRDSRYIPSYPTPWPCGNPDPLHLVPSILPRLQCLHGRGRLATCLGFSSDHATGGPSKGGTPWFCQGLEWVTKR